MPRSQTMRNRHMYNPRQLTSNINFSNLISLTLSNNSLLEEPLLQFTNIIKKNAINKIIKWYRQIKSKQDFIGR